MGTTVLIAIPVHTKMSRALEWDTDGAVRRGPALGHMCCESPPGPVITVPHICPTLPLSPHPHPLQPEEEVGTGDEALPVPLPEELEAVGLGDVALDEAVAARRRVLLGRAVRVLHRLCNQSPLTLPSSRGRREEGADGRSWARTRRCSRSRRR